MRRGGIRTSDAAPLVALLLAAALLVGVCIVARASAGPRRAIDPGLHAGTLRVAADGVAVRPVVPARRAGSVRPERPVTSRLPSGKVVPVRPVATRVDGRLAVPDDIRVAGWWRGGSKLGDPFGSTLLAAHIDSFTQGLGPYAELLSVRPGQVVVLRSAHLRQAFTIRSLRLIPQGSLEHRRWIYSARGPRRLTLVTCAGPYDAGRGGYQNLAVVTATPGGGAPPVRAR